MLCNLMSLHTLQANFPKTKYQPKNIKCKKPTLNCNDSVYNVRTYHHLSLCNINSIPSRIKYCYYFNCVNLVECTAYT